MDGDEVRMLDEQEQASWVRFAAVLELLPGVLDVQLRRTAGLTYFEYVVLAMLSDADDRTLQLTALAAKTSSTLPRLSNVITRLEDRGLVDRVACPTDRRATNARLTDRGQDEVRHATPGHVVNVRSHVLDALTRDQIEQLARISTAILGRLDPDGVLTDSCLRSDVTAVAAVSAGPVPAT